tara:strand:- start:466 stop:855 length:390 start_codon:yes stop_codon:yes gene_type:complete
MAKSGRYSADRKKIEALTADKTVEVHDCGTIFTADPSGAGFTVTLPSPEAAGPGWWCKVVRISDSGNDVTVAVGGNPVKGLEISGGFTALGATADIILSGAKEGLQVEMISDGTNWLALAHGRLAADIT